MEQTFILGKDLSLETSIDNFKQQLQNIGLAIEESSWLNPLPNVWSVHIKEKNCPLCFSNGKGATKKAALASALGEFVERLTTNYFFADFYLGETLANQTFVHYPQEKWFPITKDNKLPSHLLDPYLLLYFDPEDNLPADQLVDLQSSNTERGICALPYIRQSDNQTVYIPVNIIGNLYVSNGMSAGNTLYEARVQALSEILERYIRRRILLENLTLPQIPDAVIHRYSKTEEALKTLEQQGFSLLCYDASLGGIYPVICVALFNQKQGGCFVSFGSHPCFEIALERTVTEMLQGRSLQDLDSFSSPSFSLEEVADDTNLETHFIDASGLVSWDLFRNDPDFNFVDWNFSGTSENEYQALMAIFKELEYEVYIADYNHLESSCCRILIPGISEIYPVDDLQQANNNVGISLRQTLCTLPSSNWPNDFYLNLYQQLEEQEWDDLTRIRELLGLAVTRDDGWYTLRMGELKALLALAGGDFESALSWVDWTLEFNASTFSTARINFYHCLKTNLELELLFKSESDKKAYSAAFEKMYSKQTLLLVKDHLTQKQRFFDLHPIDNRLSQLSAHQALLSIYQKLHLAKQSHYNLSVK